MERISGNKKRQPRKGEQPPSVRPIRVDVTPSLYEALDRRCRKAGLSKAAVLRALIVQFTKTDIPLSIAV